ncbi:MAG TPA: ABC transporter ATP-binding protein [Burkholderiaceae bacterium]|nr:ABC transporter ATP-binding protein [Burkholderiaceae bacterium]
MSSAAPLARLRAIDKRFGSGTLALAGLSLDVLPGEFLSLVGPSGCGKSTALRLIAGLAQPSSGTVERPARTDDERPVQGAGDAGHGLAFVFQEPTLMPWATVADNVSLPLRLSGTRGAQADRRVDEALERVGLAGFARAFPRELSGGMKMRVSIARAVVTRPRLLLMDEPFAALDEITRMRLNDDVLALRDELSLTIVFVTHSVYESVYLSDRILVMSARPGRVVAEHRIGAPRPRGEAFRTSADYGLLCRDVSRSLRAAMAAGER